ncbi:MAG: divalent-cation tolerance protein CutA [bacterium]|nr:divalent-cation tolerance protein CutA [bacterium]
MSRANLMILTTTFASEDDARQTAHLLVDAGLAVCAQVEAPMESVFQWKGAICTETEVRVTFKILGERFDLFCGELKLNHPYDVPQLIAWPATFTEMAYLQWARGQGKGGLGNKVDGGKLPENDGGE